ncbi:MAG: triose-phosphate isomerase [Thermoplasmata archaeon]|nr:triose-phosphate isomerase [Thermoplasmata archaeon]
MNLKTYPACLGPAAERFGTLLGRLAEEAGVASAIAPATPDLGRVAAVLSLPVLAQHVDPVEAGQRTGSVPVEALRACGVVGSLLNHSEHRMEPLQLQDAIRRLRDAGLVPVVCAGSPEEAETLARFQPPYLAIEPPELIGGTVSVSTAQPQVIQGTVARVRRVAPDTHVLCGAGIHHRSDVAAALDLGSQGILVASAVAKSSDPERAIIELLAGF